MKNSLDDHLTQVKTMSGQIKETKCKIRFMEKNLNDLKFEIKTLREEVITFEMSKNTLQLEPEDFIDHSLKATIQILFHVVLVD